MNSWTYSGADSGGSTGLDRPQAHRRRRIAVAPRLPPGALCSQPITPHPSRRRRRAAAAAGIRLGALTQLAGSGLVGAVTQLGLAGPDRGRGPAGPGWTKTMSTL